MRKFAITAVHLAPSSARPRLLLRCLFCLVTPVPNGGGLGSLFSPALVDLRSTHASYLNGVEFDC